MKRFVAFITASLATAALVTGCGGPSGQHKYTTPYGVRAHSPTFGLPPKGLTLPPQQTGVPTLEMFDSVTVSTVPHYARAVAGYTSGFWPTYNPLVAAFPRAYHVSIAINTAHRARCLDIEPGDATPSQAAGWYFFVRGHGFKPCFYANLSTMPSVRGNLAANHIPRSAYLLWDANWTYRAHLDAGYDATQWSDRALNRNLDESTVSYAFVGVVPQPKPHPHPQPKPKPAPFPHLTPAQRRQLNRDFNRRHHLRHLITRHQCRRHHVHHPWACFVWFAEGKQVNAQISHLEKVGK